jgi:hypothetical protein
VVADGIILIWFKKDKCSVRSVTPFPAASVVAVIVIITQTIVQRVVSRPTE